MTVLDRAIVLITGSAGGFGREMTRQFLQAGSLLVLADRELSAVHGAAAQVAAGLAGQVPGRVLGYIAADLATPGGVDSLFQQAQAITQQIDVLVNNAGIAHSGAFVDVPQPAWERLMQVNLLAPMRLTAKFLPAMVARRNGHVVHMASCAGLVGTPGIAAYSTAKFGLRGFGEALGHELQPHNVTVTTVYPFFARTPILNSEQFGETAPSGLPEALIDDPAMVIAEVIAGIETNKRHIYPGPTAKRIERLQRLGPWAVPLVSRMLARR